MPANLLKLKSLKTTLAFLTDFAGTRDLSRTFNVFLSCRVGKELDEGALGKERAGRGSVGGILLGVPSLTILLGFDMRAPSI